MAKTEINITLNTKSITDAIQNIEQHRVELLAKFDLFMKRLGAYGIDYAQVVCGDYEPYILFSSVVTVNGNLINLELILKAKYMVKEYWLQADGSVKSADVNPVLMEEFGSGWRASTLHASESNTKAGVTVGGQGTFPNQTHAFNERGWKYVDLNGDWHWTVGYQGSMPLLHAIEEMYQRVKQVEIEVFGL